MNEGLQIPIPRRLVLVRIVLSCGMLLSLLLCHRLWTGPRSFPRAPLAGIHLSQGWEIALFTLITLCLAGSMFFRWQRITLAGALLLCLVMLLADVNRVQPWFYLYASMLLVFVFYSGRVDDANHYTTIFIVIQLIFVSVYFMAGIDLLQADTQSEMSALAAPFMQLLSERQFGILLTIVPALPYLLMFTGIALLIPAMRYLALSFAVTGHVLLIWLLFPSPASPLYAGWMVNLVFLALLPLLCSGRTKQRHFSFSTLLISPVFYLALIVFVVLPVIPMPGKGSRLMPQTPGMLTRPSRDFLIGEAAYTRLPYYLRTYCKKSGELYRLDTTSWCVTELRATPYPSRATEAAVGAILKASTGMVPNGLTAAHTGDTGDR
jgi:hypothetical protein